MTAAMCVVWVYLIGPPDGTLASQWQQVSEAPVDCAFAKGFAGVMNESFKDRFYAIPVGEIPGDPT